MEIIQIFLIDFNLKKKLIIINMETVYNFFLKQILQVENEKNQVENRRNRIIFCENLQSWTK